MYTILIPVRDGSNEIELTVDELPDDVHEISNILLEERAPCSVWLDCAIGYIHKNQGQNFLTLANEALAKVSDLHKDKITVYNTITAYYIQQVVLVPDDKEKRDSFLSNANRTFNRLELVPTSYYEPSTWLGKGALHLVSKEYDRALEQMKLCLTNPNTPETITTPALIGKGTALYHLKEYSSALSSFREALERNPDCPANVRLGLGLCYFQLDRPKLAKKWFERVLQLDSSNADAMCALATMAFNDKQKESGKKEEGLKLVERAFKANPFHPKTLIYLSTHFFMRQKYSESAGLARECLRKTNSTEIRSEGNYLLGRNAQCQGDYEGAYKYFSKSVELWPDYPLAQHGLAQMLIHRHENVKAIKLLDQILAKYPDNPEALILLAHLYSVNKPDLSLQYLEKVAQQNPSSCGWEIWIELAQLRELSRPLDALKAYETAIDLLQRDEKPVPYELWNNVGALRHKVRQYDAAEAAYQQVLQAKGESLETITTQYNIARLYEDTYRTIEAKQSYLSLLKNHPNFIECYLRLATLAFQRRQLDQAHKWIQTAFDVDLNNIEAWTLSGNFYLKEMDWQKAQEKFEHILKNIETHDAYATISLANLYFYAATMDHKTRAEKATQFIDRASSYYLTVLQRQPNNVYAANGIGMVLAYRAHYNEARHCLTQVRESFALNKNPDVWINLAHVYQHQQHHDNAIQTYDKCLKFFNDNSAPLYHSIAASSFYSDKLDDCRSALLSAIHLDPTDLTLWFNLAICQTTFVSHVVKKKTSALLKEVQQAKNCIVQAEKLLNVLIEKAKVPKYRQYSATRCKSEIVYCEGMQSSLQRLEAEVLREIEIKQNKHRIQVELAQKAREQLEIQQAEKNRKKQERSELLAQTAANMEKEKHELEKRWASERKRQRTSDFEVDDDDDIVTDALSSAGTPAAGKRANKKRKRTASDKLASTNTTQNEDEEEAPEEDTRPTTKSAAPADETWEQMRNRRGGLLNKLVVEQRQEEESKKRRDIEQIYAGREPDDTTSTPRGARKLRKNIRRNVDNEEDEDRMEEDTNNNNNDNDDNNNNNDDNEENNSDIDEETDKELIREKLEEVVAGVKFEDLATLKWKNIYLALVEKKVPKAIIRANKQFAKNSASRLLKQARSKFLAEQEAATASGEENNNDDDKRADEDGNDGNRDEDEDDRNNVDDAHGEEDDEHQPNDDDNESNSVDDNRMDDPVDD